MTSVAAVSTIPPIHNDRSLPALTGIRFLAALAVVVAHFTERGLLPSMPGVVEFLDGGRTAVSLFFVLSGFVLAYNYPGLAAGGRRDFYVARLARIWPTVLLALALSAVGVGYAWAHRDEGVLSEWFGVSAHPEVFLGLSFAAQLVMATGWLPAASLNQPWNGPAWSISCEVFFYALFPLLIVWLRGLSRWSLTAVLLVAFGLQIAWVFGVAPLAPVGQTGFLIYQFPLPHLVEFLCGIVAALWFARGGRDWLREGRRRELLLVAALAPAVALSLVRPVVPAYLPISPFFAVLVVALAAPPARRRSWLTWSPLLLLGEASFALYLVHIPLLNIVSVWSPPQALGPVLLVAFTLISVGLFRFYESPARRLVRRVLSRAELRRRPGRDGGVSAAGAAASPAPHGADAAGGGGRALSGSARPRR